MNIFSILDVPSLLFSGSAVVAGGIAGGRNIQKGFLVARDIAIPIGIVGTLIGFVNILSMIDDPSALGPSVGIAFLTTFYGILIFALCHTLSTWYPKKSIASQEPVVIQNALAIGVFTIFLIGGITYKGSLFHFMDITSLGFVLLIVLLPTFLEKQNTPEQKSYLEHKSLVICKYSLIALVAGILYSGISVLMNLADPAAIGPAMAIGLVTPLYCCLFIVAGRMINITLTNPQPLQDIYTNTVISSMMLVVALFILFCVGVLFSLV